jgi:hypothetical protein
MMVQQMQADPREHPAYRQVRNVRITCLDSAEQRLFGIAANSEAFD